MSPTAKSFWISLLPSELKVISCDGFVATLVTDTLECFSLVRTVLYGNFILVRLKGVSLARFFFNILMHRLLTSLPNIPGNTITSYADAICIHSTSPRDLQLLLDSLSVASSQCDIIVSPEKSRIFSCRPHQTLPDFIIGKFVIPLCLQYRYLGVPVKISPVLAARRQVHPIVSDLLARLQRRLTPLQWISNHSSGISIPVAMQDCLYSVHSLCGGLSLSYIDSAN